MYVIMDAEWYEGKNFAFLTQISGLRIDATYHIVDRCDKLAAPGASISHGLINWKKICFAGYQKSDFTSASPLSISLEEICQWLNPDDILIWWHSDAENMFRDSCRRFNLPVWKSCSIHQYLRKLAPRDKRSGSSYQICRRNGIQVCSPEHRSASDILTLYNLMSAYQFPIHLLELSNWEQQLCDSLSISVEPPEKKPQKLCRLLFDSYVLDGTTHLVHRVGCGKYPKSSRCPEITLPSAIRRKLKPCDCCYKDFENYVFNHAVTKENTSLVCCAKSHHKILHHSDCKVISRVDPNHLKALSSSQGAIATGYRFCKACSTVTPYYQPISYYVERFCNNNGLKCYFKENILHIVSQFDRWQVAIHNETGVLTLFHRNKGKHKDPLPETQTPNHHLQESAPHTLPGILKYIVSHDRYKRRCPAVELPRNSKKRKEKNSFGRNSDSHDARAQRKKHYEKQRSVIAQKDYDEMMEDYNYPYVRYS